MWWAFSDDERQVSVAKPSQPEIEVCLPQITPGNMFYGPAGMAMDLAVRTERDPAAMTPELRRVLREASPELANSTFTTMTRWWRTAMAASNLPRGCWRSLAERRWCCALPASMACWRTW